MNASQTLLAQATKPSHSTGGVQEVGQIIGQGPIGSRPAAEAPLAFADLASTVLGFLTLVAGLAFLLYFVLGGLQWLTSSGDASKVESAKNQMVGAAIGLVVVIAAYAIAGLVGMIFGIDILFVTPMETIDKLAPL